MCSKMLIEAAVSHNSVHVELEDDDSVVIPPLNSSASRL